MIGMVPGRSDMVLYYNGTATHIEMKLPGNYQQPNQKHWQAQVEAQGFAYHICRSLEEFQTVIQGVI
jgi:sulfur relay (sulfurtransferase) complex TusBCD TusD component (DsrE family)